VSPCGERAADCGSYSTPVYGGDPVVCLSGCATAESTCDEFDACEAMLDGPA
jgi:hypothetical protein